MLRQHDPQLFERETERLGVHSSVTDARHKSIHLACALYFPYARNGDLGADVQRLDGKQMKVFSASDANRCDLDLRPLRNKSDDYAIAQRLRNSAIHA